MKYFTPLYIVLFFRTIEAQEYRFLQFFIKDQNIHTPVQKEWEPLIELSNPINEEFLRDLWEPIPTKGLPSIEPFLKDISLQHLNLFVENTIDGTGIDVESLDIELKIVEDTSAHLKNGGTFCQLSRPFINCSKNWVIIFFTCHSQLASGSGQWYIYRKVDGAWKLYHRLTTYLT